ncbi:MAG: hypothetical protein KIPDCIKN_04117 [Haliscomenobacter sp.]|nr:hypothetical protein [Haliscomenobacter sp.]
MNSDAVQSIAPTETSGALASWLFNGEGLRTSSNVGFTLSYHFSSTYVQFSNPCSWPGLHQSKYDSFTSTFFPLPHTGNVFTTCASKL